ncbi:MAG: 2-C-methyl-D-erythritol 4-phosphate cytidylyltransferase [Oscillospiraceae bacterium]|nr:2-C-methyl-D-erythritol 4-phosphate cytidylyltransferase [Oscillospiraceae bacterium]
MNIGVIFAGGVGRRMHSKERPKQFLEIYNKPIIVHTIEHFESNPLIDGVVVACVEEWIDYFSGLVYQYRLDKVRKIVPGGETGQLSIYNGLVAAEELAGEERSIVLIHDGVRPLITSDLITKNIEAVKKYGSSITSAAVTETIIEIGADGEVKNIPARSDSRVAKAPQSFWLDDILAAHRQALAEGRTDFIDSCTLMRHYGHQLHTTDGPYENIKITTPGDFYTMRALLQVKEDAQIYGLE